MSDWKLIPVEMPKNGTRWVALYNDGGGAKTFLTLDNGDIIDEDGDVYDIECIEECFLHWQHTPEHYKLWCETKGE